MMNSCSVLAEGYYFSVRWFLVNFVDLSRYREESISKMITNREMGVLYYNDRTIISKCGNNNITEYDDVGDEINVSPNVIICGLNVHVSYSVKANEGRQSKSYNSNVHIKLRHTYYVNEMLPWLRTRYENFILTYSILQIRAGQHAALEESICVPQSLK